MEYVCNRYQVTEEFIDGEFQKVFKGRKKTLRDVLKYTVTKYAQKEGFISANRRWSFGHFNEMVENAAFALQKKFHVKEGDRVAILMGTDLEFPLILFAAIAIGAIAVPLNTRFTGEELIYEINNSECNVLIMDNEFWVTVEPIMHKFENVKHIFVNGSHIPPNTLPYSLLTKKKTGEVNKVKLEENDIVMIMYTSGTTGDPKGAMLHHRGIIQACMLMDDIVASVPDADRMLNVLPMFHSAGAIMCSIASLFMGIPCIYLRKFKTEKVLETIESEKITVMVHVPTVYWLVLNHSKFKKYDISSLRVAIVGGAPKNERLVKQVREKMPGTQFIDTFGITEIHTLDFILPDDKLDEHIDSVGRVAPIEEVRIVDEQGNECATNVPGEILIKGSKIMSGYWKNTEETDKAIVNGWFHTGDVGRIDENGYVYPLGRIKDMINRGGENIYSFEVEKVLCRHPEVSEAAVVGIEDEVYGEEVKAFVLLRKGTIIDEEKLKVYCARYLADYKVPKCIEFVSEFPRTPSGKIIKKALIGKVEGR
jgi:acyl-CoA synthetase (AMP-forming)/AMP-acid ligase II